MHLLTIKLAHRYRRPQHHSSADTCCSFHRPAASQLP